MRTATDILRDLGLPLSSLGESRYYVTCPHCSAERSRAHQNALCLGITIDDKGVMWGCNHCGRKGGELFQKANGHGDKEQFTATYDYVDEYGTLLFQKVRNRPGSTQRFFQRKPNGRGWINNTKDVRKVIYRLPEVIEAIANEHMILCVEGEKDCDNLRRVGVPATCNPDGAADAEKKPKWRPEFSEMLRGADIVIIPDNDAPGYAHARATAQMSAGVAKRVRILKLTEHWPDCPQGGDVSDWLAVGHTREELDALIESAPDWSPREVVEASPTLGAKKTASALQFARLDEVEAKHVEWLWHNRLARGKLTLLAGEPGIGKSQTACDIGARISKGAEWPDGSRAPRGSVIVLSAEDSANDTLRPRFEAADADLTRVHVLQATLVDDKPVTFSLQAHLEMLGAKLTEVGHAALIIIDPITSYMGKIDGHQTVDVRTVLEPLAAFAEKYNVAVLAISHPPKATQAKALHAVTGSLAFVAAARLVFIAAKEPQTERRLLLAVKNNLGPPAAGIGFHLAQSFVGNDILTSYVCWDSQPVTTTADEAIAASNNEGQTAMKEAMEFLRDELAASPQAAQDIKKAATSAGFSWATIRRAKDELKIRSVKGGLQDGWFWELPKVLNREGQDAHS